MQYKGGETPAQRASWVFTPAISFLWVLMRPVTALPAASAPANTRTSHRLAEAWRVCSGSFDQSSEMCLLLAQGRAGPEAGKNSGKCSFVQFWARFPWALCPRSTRRGFQGGSGLICAALSSLLLLRSASFPVVGGYWQHLKRWRKAFGGLSPGTGPWRGRVHVAAATLAMLWCVVYSRVQHCRRLQNATKCLERSPCSVIFQVLLSAWSWFFEKVRD